MKLLHRDSNDQALHFGWLSHGSGRTRPPDTDGDKAGKAKVDPRHSSPLCAAMGGVGVAIEYVLAHIDEITPANLESAEWSNRAPDPRLLEKEWE